MQRGLSQLQRITLQRMPALLPCAPRKGDSCGTRIKYAPSSRCPECQQKQLRQHAPPPPDGALILDRDTAIIDAETGEVAVVYAVCAQVLANDLAASLRNVGWMDQYADPSSAARLSGMAVVHNTFRRAALAGSAY